MAQGYSVEVVDKSKPEPQEHGYKVIKTQKPVLPWQIESLTGEPALIGKKGFDTQEEAQAAIAELEATHKPNQAASFGKLGAEDSTSEQQLLSKETPAMQRYWGDKASKLEQFTKPGPAKAQEPEPPAKLPGTNVSAADVEALEERLEQLRSERDSQKAEAKQLDARIAQLETTAESLARLSDCLVDEF